MEDFNFLIYEKTQIFGCQICHIRIYICFQNSCLIPREPMHRCSMLVQRFPCTQQLSLFMCTEAVTCTQPRDIPTAGLEKLPLFVWSYEGTVRAIAIALLHLSLVWLTWAEKHGLICSSHIRLHGCIENDIESMERAEEWNLMNLEHVLGFEYPYSCLKYVTPAVYGAAQVHTLYKSQLSL